ncbi:MAG TPA: HEAT repeat domain-containing protein, partial [Longilinea sp.]|nr:HEAT repeat domain-containing protein [Longilinea sp.]
MDRISELNDFLEEQEIHELIQNLKSPYPEVQRQAHKSLVHMGDDAIPSLIALMHEGNPRLENEVAQILGEMTSPSSPRSLVANLENEAPLVRWDATKALIMMGRAGVVALMEALIENCFSIWLRDAARDVLKELSTNHHLTQAEEKVLA